ncbi:hypothetical protein EOK75_07360 [Pseudorhodobacter turbinis]|uniref:Uncharacterized protein n=1 Tax=Pseudorhodobacter turbinis TaxID=2500533 RepID=A0A4P8EI16_9RHOB|nr:hypothetical protein EOK75_07360 [Pseudorhodobacter turbinis]
MAKPAIGDWIQDRLAEARGVLADCTRYPDTLVILAARVVVGHTDDAIDLLGLLDHRSRHQTPDADTLHFGI